MQDNKEERSIAQALGSVPKVYNQRAFSCTVTIAGTGLSDILTDEIYDALSTQHLLVGDSTPDQMYVHEIRAYGTAGGYLSLAPYPHRQMTSPTYTANTVATATMFNSYNNGSGGETESTKGSLCQMYEFGINGATRPELVWKYPKAEIINDPFLVFNVRVLSTTGEDLRVNQNQTKICTIQSTNTGGNALYILQFDVTVRNSQFIPIASTLGGAAYGELNLMDDNYKPPRDKEKKTEEGLKAEETANKKRKVKSVKDLTLPALDSN